MCKRDLFLSLVRVLQLVDLLCISIIILPFSVRDGELMRLKLLLEVLGRVAQACPGVLVAVMLAVDMVHCVQLGQILWVDILLLHDEVPLGCLVQAHMFIR